MDQGVNQQQTQEQAETPGVNLLGVRAGKVTKMGLGAAGGVWKGAFQGEKASWDEDS